MMADVSVPYLMRYKIIQEALITATKLDDLVVTMVNGATKTRYEHFGLELLRFVKYMRTWREAGVVKVKSNTSPKLKNKVITCLFAGYADNHEGDCCRM